METLEEKPRRHYKLSTVLYCAGVSWGAAAYGYGASIIATTMGQPSFLHEMGLDTASNASSLLGAANALYFVGGLFGCVMVGLLADRYGRKKTILLGAIILLVASAILAGSTNIAVFIVFRLLSGIGGYMELVAVPLWVAEIVPPKDRGILSDISPIFINIGYVCASWVGVGFYYYKNVNAWRAPIALGCLPAIFCIVAVFFVPESPRYLLLRDRSEEAWKVVQNLHTWHGDETFARREFQQMNQQIELERSLPGGYLAMVRRPSYRKRVWMTVLLLFTLVSSGVLVINNYATITYGRLGYSPEDQLFLQAGWLVASWASNMVAPLWVDRMSRPTLMTIGLAGCCFSVIMEAAFVATYGDTHNKAGLGACAAFNFLFVFFYGGFLDGVTWWYTAEIFPTHLRAQGMTIGMFTYALTNIVWLQAAPTAFASIGWRYYLFFIVFTALGAVVVWFTFPDTLNRPLEEVAKLFGDDDLVAAYQDHGLVITSADDHKGTIEDGTGEQPVVHEENVHHVEGEKA